MNRPGQALPISVTAIPVDLFQLISEQPAQRPVLLAEHKEPSRAQLRSTVKPSLWRTAHAEDPRALSSHKSSQKQPIFPNNF